MVCSKTRGEKVKEESCGIVGNQIILQSRKNEEGRAETSLYFGGVQSLRGRCKSTSGFWGGSEGLGEKGSRRAGAEVISQVLRNRDRMSILGRRQDGVSVGKADFQKVFLL